MDDFIQKHPYIRREAGYLGIWQGSRKSGECVGRHTVRSRWLASPAPSQQGRTTQDRKRYPALYLQQASIVNNLEDLDEEAEVKCEEEKNEEQARRHGCPVTVMSTCVCTALCVWHSLGSGQELTWQHGGESSSKDIIYGRETRGSILTFRHFNTRRPSQDARTSFFPLFFSFLLSSPDWCCRQGLHFISGEFHLFLSALPTIGLSFISPFIPSFVHLFDDLLVYLTNHLSVHLFDRLLAGLYVGSFVWSFIRLIVCCFDRSSFLFINVFFVLFFRSCSSFSFLFDGSFVWRFARLMDRLFVGWFVYLMVRRLVCMTTMICSLYSSFFRLRFFKLVFFFFSSYFRVIIYLFDDSLFHSIVYSLVRFCFLFSYYSFVLHFAF